MGKKFTLTEHEKLEIKKLYLNEQSETKKDDRKFCHGGNVKSLEEIVGGDETEDISREFKLDQTELMVWWIK